jgi:CubicO group peptidase (beta-lactamase class C family)
MPVVGRLPFMQAAIGRRLFFQQALAAPVVIPSWKAAPPPSYWKELGEWMRAAPVPGAVVGLVENRKPAWIKPLGVRAAGSPEPVTPATLFQAASLTKQVTAYAAFALRAQGKLDFDKLLVDYLDDLPDATARTVTLRHVLSHSSGFPNWRSGEASKPLPDLVPAFPPGSKFQYSGEGFFYLQRILEKVTGLGYGQLVSDLVFKPLEMTSSSVVWNPDTLARTALPHDRRGELRANWDKNARSVHQWAARAGRAVAALRYEDYTAVARERGDPALPNWMVPNGAASLVTSAEDYSRFVAAAIRNPDIGRQQVSINEFLGWGLGWGVERAAGHTYLWQWGDNGGFKNIVLAEPSTGSVLFVFTNGDAGTRIYDRVLTHATGHDHPLLFWL